jgi:hypothetical protein
MMLARPEGPRSIMRDARRVVAVDPHIFAVLDAVAHGCFHMVAIVPRDEAVRGHQHGLGLLAEAPAVSGSTENTGITRNRRPEGRPYTDICPLKPPLTKL